MPGWLSKARQTLGLTAEQQPQPFQITCACRNEMTGIRQPAFQTMRCAQCGQTLFILPRDPYPPLKTDDKRRPTGMTKPGDKPKSAAEQDDLRDERTQTTSTRTTAQPDDPVKDADRPRDVTEFVAAPQMLEPVVEVPPQRRRLFGRLRRGRRAEPQTPKGMLDRSLLKRRTVFTPFRLVIVGLLAIVAVTVYFTVGSHRVDQAEIDLTQHGDKGLSLLKAHDYPGAAAELELSCRALDILGWDNGHVRLLRQAHREAVALSNLAMAPLLEIVQDGGAAAGNIQLRQDRFNALFKDKWVVVQTKATRRAPANEWGGDNRRAQERADDIVAFECPITVAGSQLRLIADSQAIDRVLPDGAQNQDVIIGGRFAAYRRASDGEVTISFDGESLFLWSGSDTLEDLGFDVGDTPAGKAVKSILERQSQLLGVSR